MIRPALRRGLAEKAVARHGVSIALACRTFGVSETCYRYSPLLSDENEEIADLLVGLTTARKTWGFGLCFLHLRNVQGHPWNHKRVYRIYCELELNLRIKPRKRLKRDKPDALAVPDAPNVTWSMDFMADRLGDGRAFRLLNVLDDFNREGLVSRSIFLSLPKGSSAASTGSSNGVENQKLFGLITSYARNNWLIWHQVIVISSCLDTFIKCLSLAIWSTTVSPITNKEYAFAALTVLKTRSSGR